MSEWRRQKSWKDSHVFTKNCCCFFLYCRTKSIRPFFFINFSLIFSFVVYIFILYLFFISYCTFIFSSLIKVDSRVILLNWKNREKSEDDNLLLFFLNNNFIYSLIYSFNYFLIFFSMESQRRKNKNKKNATCDYSKHIFK